MKKSIVVLFFFFGCISANAQSDSIAYSFLIAGHTHGAPGINNFGLHPHFKAEFDYIQSRPEIKFGVFTGDIVSGNPEAKDWDEVDADIEALGLPIYFAAGNHDVEDRALFESRYGNTYYSFIHNNDLFITLDPNPADWNIEGEQLTFLKKTVCENALGVDNIFVFFHQILWKESDNPFEYIAWNSGSGKAAEINFWPEVMPIFHDLPNEVFMFAGDLGAAWSSQLTYDNFDNITLIASGMGDEAGQNFIVANVNAQKQVNFDVICIFSAGTNGDMNCLGELKDHQVVSELTSTWEKYACETDILPAEFSVFPNPTTNYLTIRLPTARKITVQLLTFQGVKILEKKFSDEFSEHEIDVSNFAQGTYILRIINGEGDRSVVLVKV